MSITVGTGTGIFANSDGNIYVGIVDESNNALFVKCATGYIPSSVAGYAMGCLLLDTTTGYVYSNTGSTSSATWTQLASGGYSGTLPATVTDASTTTTTSLAYTQNLVTTGSGITQSLNALTTGKGYSITHTTDRKTHV